MTLPTLGLVLLFGISIPAAAGCVLWAWRKRKAERAFLEWRQWQDQKERDALAEWKAEVHRTLAKKRRGA